MLHYLASVLTGINIAATIICFILVLAIICMVFYFVNCVKFFCDEDEDEYKSCIGCLKKLILAIIICSAILIFVPDGKAFLEIVQN